MKILILGASGMLGNAMVRILSEKDDWDVVGCMRSENFNKIFSKKISKKIISGIDVEKQDDLLNLFTSTRPDVVVNCIGLIKQLENGNDPLSAIPINSLFPHRLAKLCMLSNTRLIHISTDCVFSGKVGDYTESDYPDSNDIYGRSKFLGEVSGRNIVTIRTSIIGHEFKKSNGLLEWFLQQKDECKGFTRAIFSGMPTVVLSKIIRDIIIPNTEINGIYHVSSNPISKYNLLVLFSEVYSKKIKIVPDDSLIINRSKKY